ncbi:MAG: glycosyltransferase family 2 protein [Patescibacteria group bacterium]
MKLIVNIPCYNEEENSATVIKEIPREIPGIDKVEVLIMDDGSKDRTIQVAREAGADYIISHKTNLGLATTFRDALEEAICRGADIIVNTDGDNHYDQSKIPELIKPILEKRADIVIGSRKNLNTKNKNLNKIGSAIMTKWAGIPKYDVSTGYRAYSKEAAMKIGVYSLHTYVHTTLLSAQDLKLSMMEIPIADRPVDRPSRLIKNIPDHIWKAGWNIVTNIVIFRSLRFFGILGFLMFLPGIIVIGRFLYFYAIGDGDGHIQSLLLAAVLMIVGFLNIVLGLLGSSIGWSRKVSEDILYRVKKLEIAQEEQNNEKKDVQP